MSHSVNLHFTSTGPNVTCLSSCVIGVRTPRGGYNGKLNLLSTILLLSITASASQDLLDRAKELYQRTDYKASLQVLAQDQAPSAATHCLIGKNHFMLGDWKLATDSFEQALALAPNNAEYALWLGRAYGRRAETSNWMMAGFHAAKAREYLEKAVNLSPHDG